MSRFLTLAVVALALSACRGDPVSPPLAINALGVVPPTVAGAVVGDSIRVRVVEAGSTTPRGGVSVAFAVSAGGGTVSPGIATTDADGRAAAKFTTGTTVGVNTVTATIAGSAPATITLTTVAGPATTLSIRERIAFIDAGQRFTPEVTASDVNGNVVPPSQLLFEARTPVVVSLAADGSMTGIGLSQTLVVVSSGAIRDSVLVVVTTPNGPVLQSDLTRLDVARDTTFTLPVILDMRTSAARLGATTVTVRWDPAQLVFVSHADGASNAGALVNANGVSQGMLSMAVASVAGLPGRIELRRLTFKAGATAGRTGTLRLIISELSAAGTFADLLPRTAAVSYPLSIR